MKLSIILEKLKDVKGIWSSPDQIVEATGLSAHQYNFWSMRDDECPFTEKAFLEWICTDTHVGWKIIYMHDKPILVSWQACRKCEIELFWIGKPERKIRKWAEAYLDYGDELGRIKMNTDLLDTTFSFNKYIINIFKEEKSKS